MYFGNNCLEQSKELAVLVDEVAFALEQEKEERTCKPLDEEKLAALVFDVDEEIRHRLRWDGPNG